MLVINIETVDHDVQRYNTIGDWHVDATGAITIQVSKLDDWKMEALIGLHELIETILCVNRGISGEMVDDFDIGYENNREAGDNSEPGDSPDCPYRKEHFFATSIERLMAAELNIDWSLYEKRIEDLYKKEPK